MSDKDNPQEGFQPEETVIRPMPGGSRGREQRTTISAKPVVSDPPPVALDESALGTDISSNRYLSAARMVLIILRSLQNLPSHDNIQGLRARLVTEINNFETAARSRGISAEDVYAARYVLCTVLDEAVLVTPWGSDSGWAADSLLTNFHNETFGGEKFFLVLDELSGDPDKNVEILELLYVCLAMGFRGKYHVMDEGRAQLQDRMARLYPLLRERRRAEETDLSPNWRGLEDQSGKIRNRTPIWLSPIIAAAILLGAYMAILFGLNEASDPAFAQIQALGREMPVLKPERKVVASSPPSRRVLTDLFAEEQRRGILEVMRSDQGTIIRVFNKGLFASGSTSINESYRALFSKIGRVISESPGSIIVAGHTDNIPIRTLKFPSNWHLSEQRAIAVATMLTASLGQTNRLTVEGRSDSEAIADNATEAGRATNRRVEIILEAY